jgi:hypothetical protein
MDNADRRVRIAGWILLGTGVLLTGSLGWLIYWLQDVIAHPGARGRWTGDPVFTEATLRLLYSVLLFGATSVVAGLFQVVTARRSRLVLAPTFFAAIWLGYSLWALLSLEKTL